MVFFLNASAFFLSPLVHTANAKLRWAWQQVQSIRGGCFVCGGGKGQERQQWAPGDTEVGYNFFFNFFSFKNFKIIIFLLFFCCVQGCRYVQSPSANFQKILPNVHQVMGLTLKTKRLNDPRTSVQLVAGHGNPPPKSPLGGWRRRGVRVKGA